jgi:hypothetical protein
MKNCSRTPKESAYGDLEEGHWTENGIIGRQILLPS